MHTEAEEGTLTRKLTAEPSAAAPKSNITAGNDGLHVLEQESRRERWTL